jgi:transcriptional regulator with XRE-family HTH domain
MNQDEQEQVRDFVRTYRRKAGIPQFKLAKLADMPRSQLSEFESGYVDLLPEKLAAVKVALLQIAKQQVDDALAVALSVV